jgi:hypothetical protein
MCKLFETGHMRADQLIHCVLDQECTYDRNCTVFFGTQVREDFVDLSLDDRHPFDWEAPNNEPAKYRIPDGALEVKNLFSLWIIAHLYLLSVSDRRPNSRISRAAFCVG